ncbi:MAG: ferritin [Lentisphaeria bacterium]|nr:ferritin [Lentisphaeria bacterium]
MIKKELVNAINDQINLEFQAAYSYLGMAAYFENENLSGFANWFKVQHEEEQQHAMRLFQYLIDRGGDVSLAALSAPKMTYTTPLEVFQASLKQEEANTESINQLYDLAGKMNDHATISHLQWFIDEQVEEEKSVSEILALVERAQDEIQAMLYLNDKLAARTLGGGEIL